MLAIEPCPCGADDCPLCHPENSKAVWPEDNDDWFDASTPYCDFSDGCESCQ